MFWKFGFQNTSAIDSLLDKDDISLLEAILDEDDLLQECKSQNTRLINYFRRVDVLQRLLAYVSGEIETAERGKFKYPYVATEVLCSDIWSIVETCVTHSNQLLAPFWETILDISPEEMKTQMVMASHFAKINAVFLGRKPTEMLEFIQSQPSVIERILLHIETPSFMDLLVRIIQLDEIPAGAGVLEWLSAENLMGRLIEMLSPSHASDTHTVVADVIKGIISMAAPSPGAGLTEGLQNGPASNRFARELAHPTRVRRLAEYILNDFSADRGSIDPDDQDADTASDILESQSSENPALPNVASATSSVIHSISVLVELIRKNNSDYFEPYLWHTIRNRLIQVQQHVQVTGQDEREALEQAMKKMADRLAVVHLGGVLEVMCDCMDMLQQYLRHPRSLDGPTPTTIGPILPLTFERYRICELYAELLHCSNMSLLNRGPAFSHLYDSEGRLQGGLTALEELEQVIHISSGEERERESMDESGDETEPASQLPVSNRPHDSPSLLGSDGYMSEGSTDSMEDIMYDEAEPRSSNSVAPEDELLPQPPLVVPSSPNAASLPSPAELAAQGAALSHKRSSSLGRSSDSSATRRRSHGSRRDSRRVVLEPSTDTSPIGERLKKKLLEMDVLSTLLDLFFEFPWNNFLHSVAYDFIHQVLNGRVDGGLNRELTISLFRDARLMHRIVEGQKQNDLESAKPKGVRLGYMGHLTLISEDVIGAMEHFPPDLQLIIAHLAPQPEWDEYVNGRYIETKRRDSSLLGGGKPIIAQGGGVPRWKVDEEDMSPSAAVGGVAAVARSENGIAGPNGLHEPKGEFRRVWSSRPLRTSTADFGPAPIEEEEDMQQPSQFTRYLAQEMQSPDQFGSDDEDEEGGWLSQSTFDLRDGVASVRSRHGDHRMSSGSNGFDDAFVPGRSSDIIMSIDPFHSADDPQDDGFGPFSDSAAATGTDPFTFTSFSEDDDGPFEGFRDFGDFQVPSDGELTPTGGSNWSFTSDETSSEVSPSEVPCAVAATTAATEGQSEVVAQHEPKGKEVASAVDYPEHT